MLNVIFAISNKGDFCSLDRTCMPWGYIQEDMRYFKSMTLGNGDNALIMGRKTFESIGSKPLPGRKAIVISSTLSQADNICVAENLEDAINIGRKLVQGNLFIIGGLDLIKEALARNDVDFIYITVISGKRIDKIDSTKTVKFDYITPQNNILKSRTLYESNDYTLAFHEFWNHKDDTEEMKYIDLVKRVLEDGDARIDRTSIGTISMFAQTLRLDISRYFPLLTSKRVYWKGVVEELLWFLSGSSDTKILERKGVNIWKGNTSRKFLDDRGLTKYREGELGPGYGWQWRSFGRAYYTLEQREMMEEDGYKLINKRGVDQIIEAIRMLKEDPYSRRIIVNAWNAQDLEKMALPPCHYSFQFYVQEEKKLSILVNMRSCDVFLGLPFNIASYALLTYIIAKMVDMEPNEMVFMLGDTHIYKNHIEQCHEQIERPLRELPTLIRQKRDDIEEYTMEDFELVGYRPHSTIKADMAV